VDQLRNINIQLTTASTFATAAANSPLQSNVFATKGVAAPGIFRIPTTKY